MNLFKKPTLEEIQEQRTNDIISLLLKPYGIRLKTADFTPLELAQISNSFRRKLFNHLKTLKSEAIEKSLNEQQKANEISEAINKIE